MNVWSFTGRCGKDATVRTHNGKSVLNFPVASESGWGDNKKTVWVDCSLWGSRGEKLADHIRKGSMIGVVGELGMREHNGKQIVTVNVQDVTLLGGQPQRTESKPAARPAQRDEFDGDSLPPF